MEPFPISELQERINNIDTFICAASFEGRCFSVANNIILEKVKHRILCYNNNEDTLIGENVKKFKEVLLEPLTLQFDSDNPIVTGEALNIFFNSLSDYQLGTVLLDATTFTHEGLLIIIKFLKEFKTSYKNLFFAYVSADEYSYNTKDIKDKWLTKGIKSIRSVLGYPGLMLPTRKNHLIVLFGFESERTKKLIENLEFEIISFGFGPLLSSVSTKHYEINHHRHRDLMNLFPFAHSFEISLVNPWETCGQIIAEVEKYPNTNSVIAPMNNKISTLGSALAVFKKPELQLCYAQANEYNSSGYSTSSNQCYLINIEL